MKPIKQVTIEGESWKITMTPEEYAEWDVYTESHGHLLQPGTTEQAITMFLSHLRRGINLNKKASAVSVRQHAVGPVA